MLLSLTCVAYCLICLTLSCSSLEICIFCLNVGGKKRKEQLDPNQASAGLNPGYAGAYGATPPVSDMKYSILSWINPLFPLYGLLLK